MGVRVFLLLFSFCLLFIVIPFYVIRSMRFSLAGIGFFYAVNAVLAVYLLRKYARAKLRLESRIQELTETFNLTAVEHSAALQSRTSLNAKLIRYDSLKQILEQINRNLDLSVVAAELTACGFRAISPAHGSCLLYLVDPATRKLRLFKTLKHDASVVIKAKEGDVFDGWVMRHMSPLLVEDTRRDFRFDIDRPAAGGGEWAVGSLISSPFISNGKVLGLLRLDSSVPQAFTQDDLRFLAAICDLGAVALENSQLFEKAQDLAVHDALTGLYTKHHFLERFKEECARANRRRSALSLLMIDIDFFKKYNDTFGHTVGDFVLKKLGQTLQEFFKDYTPVIGRFGGEEFCVALPGVAKESACELAGKLCIQVAHSRLSLRRHDTAVTVSAGVAGIPGDAADDESLMNKADKALYEAKRKGRNQVCCA